MTHADSELDAAKVAAAHHRRRARTLERLVADLVKAAKAKRRCRCGVCKALRALDHG